jgi:alpha-tubulin suppressor-like RCC1 family protein
MRKQGSIVAIAGQLLCVFCTPRSLAQAGRLLGFGNNLGGELGDNTQINRSLPTAAWRVSGIKAVACGESHTLALDASGLLWAWGWNYFGQLGTGDTTPRFQPVPIMHDIKAISAGQYFSLALDSRGRVWAWGDNSNGQLGTGGTVNR